MQQCRQSPVPVLPYCVHLNAACACNCSCACDCSSVPVWKPLGVSTSAGARKLPAAALIRMSKRPHFSVTACTAARQSFNSRTSPCMSCNSIACAYCAIAQLSGRCCARMYRWPISCSLCSGFTDCQQQYKLLHVTLLSMFDSGSQVPVCHSSVCLLQKTGYSKARLHVDVTHSVNVGNFL